MKKKATIEDFKKWLSKLGLSFEFLDAAQSNDWDGGSRSICVKLCTYLNEYRINVVCREQDAGYMGCCVPSRHLSGELWTREDSSFKGGEFSEKTWNKILTYIVSIELMNMEQLT